MVLNNPAARSSSPLTSSPVPPDAEEKKRKKKKRNKGGKKKKLEAILAYHKRLVVEKGLPPSRLMLNTEAWIISISLEISILSGPMWTPHCWALISPLEVYSAKHCVLYYIYLNKGGFSLCLS